MNTLYPDTQNAPHINESKMLRSYFDSADHYQVLLNNNLQIVAYNDFAKSYTRQFFALDLDNGKNILTFFDPSFISEFEQLFNLALSGEAVYYEQYLHPDDRITWFGFHVKPLYAEGEVIGLMITGNNISKTKSQEKIIRHQSEILSLIAQLQSHHIRQPVCSILSLTQLIKEDFEVKKAYIEGLENATRQLDDVIKAIVRETRKI